MMQVELVKLAQEMSLEDGDVTNFIVFRLPSGDLVSAVVSDAGASAIIQEKVGKPLAPLEETLPPTVSFVEPNTTATIRPKPRAVTSDIKGNPVLIVYDGVDPEDVTDSSHPDEDGFGQL